MDNHDSHISVEGMNFSRDNGITILTLPPHTSNHLQLLDRCVFGPFKKYFSEAVHTWMVNHPNEPISISYSLPELCSKAWDRAATLQNIKPGFLKCGISPFDRNIFQDHDFLCSGVSDRPITVSAPLAEIEGMPAKTETVSASSTQTIPTPKPLQRLLLPKQFRLLSHYSLVPLFLQIKYDHFRKINQGRKEKIE
ncbi:DDE superfamily endonuclease [Popillia japonica]|uniref:DDE superfamily endonuclease n=1 Tax=Popillia japonica TaxID=7064 RepID=A0AAW1JI77_POPJA